MRRIVFVSSRNSCRNLLARSVMKKLARDTGLEKQLEISAAVAGDGQRKPVFPNLQAALQREGITVSPVELPVLQNRDYDRYDLLIAMDRRDLQEMYRICSGDFSDKISLLLDFTDHSGDILKPQEEKDLPLVLEQIQAECQSLLEQLKKV